MNMILDFVNDVNTENVEIKSLHIHCIQKCNKKEAGCRRILQRQSAPFPVEPDQPSSSSFSFSVPATTNRPF